jgi:hypothetical protein
MTYLKKNGNEFIENGRSRVRVRTVFHMPSQLQPGRVVKVMEVVQVIKVTEDNPIIEGNYLVLSFPSEKVNATRFTWNKPGEDWQESQVRHTISDRAVARIHAGKN